MEGQPSPWKTIQIADKETLPALSPSQTVKSTTAVLEQTLEKPKKPRKWRRVRRKKDESIATEIMNVPGVRKMAISFLLQKLLKCIVGEHVTSEYPWKYVEKEALEDNLELHEESSEFLPFKEEILSFPRPDILIIYIPDETREWDEFYVCLTESAEETVLEIINKILQEREERLNNTIWKDVGEWKTLGSEIEIEGIQDRNNRPLLEVEIESEYPIRPTKAEFRLRLVENARDGYAEILCARQTFVNLQRKRLDVSIQVTPSTAQNGSQTVCYRRNAFTQYEFEYPTIKQLSKEFRANMQSFLDNDMGRLADIMYVNSNIDFYKDDYFGLVRDIRYTCVPQSICFKPYTSFTHPTICAGKEIACHSWHPMWSGIVTIAYSDYKPTDYRKLNANEDEVMEAMYNVTPVLLWSFQDNLEPRLFLDTPREITQLSWCPYDENILVGGCVNGQVIVWDVTDKLKNVEEQEILPIRQREYRILMNSLVDWMKNTKDLKRIQPTVISELEYSQRSAVTAIGWISVHREVSKSGQIKEIPPEEERTSLQFMTASRDGTVVAWDLLAKPSTHTSLYRPHKKLRRLKKRPSALTVAVSPFRSLNKIFKPIFKVNVPAPGTTRLLPIMDFNGRVSKIDYIEKYPDPNRVFHISNRILYTPIFRRPEHPLVNQFVAGSTEGDFLVASWEGFDFNAGAVVNKETCKFENFAKFHDGPITAISRSSLFPDLILTVGGKVFALWKISLIGKPVFWKRGKCRYTHGSWNWFRPSMFRLCRVDGYIEMWHLRTRSDRYAYISFTSRDGLGMSTTHPRTMKQNILGAVCPKGVFELYYISHDLTLATEEDKWSTYRLCEREVERKRKFIKWQDEWLVKHADEVKAKQEHDLIMQEEREKTLKRAKAQLKEEEEELKREISESTAKASGPEPGHYLEWARHQLLVREKERMMKEMLRKKHLDLDLLMKQRKPVLQLAEEEKIKKASQERGYSQAGKLFDDTVAMLFPDAVEKQPPLPPDPYAGGDSMDVKVYHFEKYLKQSEECENYVKGRQYDYRFDWLTLLQSGRERRKVFDTLYHRYNHKLRLVKEKIAKQKAATVNYTYAEEASQTSLGSIDYGLFMDEVVEEEPSNEIDDENQ